MKNPLPFLTLTICLALAIFAACKKEEAQPLEEDQPIYWGNVRATVNDSLTWEGVPSAFYPIPFNDTLYAFYFDKLDELGVLRHEIAFTYIPLRVGKIQLHNDSLGIATPYETLLPRTYMSTHFGYDIVDGYFLMNETDTIEDFLEISEIDFDTKELKGRFQASYYVDSLFMTQLDNFFPDTVVFRDCTFHAKYEL